VNFLDRNSLRLILISGIALRLFQWIYDRSLWVDEAMLALNLRDLDFSGLMHPLKYDQVAPILFLWTERFMVSVFGDNEMALRMFPLLCGVAVLVLAYKVTLKATGEKGIATAVIFLFAFSRCFVYFSTETKQYSSDLLVSLAYLHTLLSTAENRNIRLLIISLIAVWLSNIGIVMITTTAFAFLLEQYRNRKFDIRQWVVVALSGAWFIVYFMVFIKGHPSGETMDDYWEQHFLPVDPTNVKFWVWLVQHFVGNYSTFLGLNIHLDDGYRAAAGTFAAAMAFAGIMRWYNTKERADWLPVLSAPIVIHLVLAALRLYPFNGRLILYLSPSFLIIAGYGAQGIFLWTRHFLLVRLCGIAAAGAFIYFISVWAPIRLEEMKDCMQYVNARRCQPLFAYAAAIPAATYYSEGGSTGKTGHLMKGLELKSTRDTAEISSSILRNDTVWVITAHKDAQVEEIVRMRPGAEKVLVTEGAAVIRLVR
jgi:hypothetical protein